MSLLQQIEKLGIPIADMAALTEQDLIRIEKRLKADVRLDDSLDLNEVLKIVDSLRKDKANIATLFHNDFEVLRDILKSEDEFIHVSVIRVKTLSDEEDFAHFLAINFEGEFAEYVDRCFKEEHYYGLYSLLCYHSVLSPELKQNIAQKLEQKLDYLTEVIYLGSDKIELKTEAAANPFFYRCLNVIGANQFEDSVGTLLNTTLDNISDKKWYFCILFAIGMLDVASNEMRQVFRGNRRAAERAGVKEIYYGHSNPRGKGGTTIGGRDSTDGFSKKLRSQEDGRPSNAVLGVMMGILFIAVYMFFWNFGPERIPKEPVNGHKSNSTSYKTELEIDAIDFLEQLRYLHSDSINIVAQKDISFNNENCNLGTKQLLNISNSFLEMKNNTNRQLLVVAENGGVNNPFFYCLNPNQQIDVMPMINTVYIYSGEEPQIVDYVGLRGDTISHFRFNTFTAADSLNLERKNTINTISADLIQQKLITITFSNGRYKVESAYN